MLKMIVDFLVFFFSFTGKEEGYLHWYLREFVRKGEVVSWQVDQPDV